MWIDLISNATATSPIAIQRGAGFSYFILCWRRLQWMHFTSTSLLGKKSAPTYCFGSFGDVNSSRAERAGNAKILARSKTEQRKIGLDRKWWATQSKYASLKVSTMHREACQGKNAAGVLWGTWKHAQIMNANPVKCPCASSVFQLFTRNRNAC